MQHHLLHCSLECGGGFTAAKFHFGEFTLDQSSYRLQRGERLLRLEKIPMELLILLVQRHGELVSREEIASHIWGKGIFVDVDRGINTAVRKIRQALREDPDKPRFLETVVGKGYRFAAHVTRSDGEHKAVGREESSSSVQPLIAPAAALDLATVSGSKPTVGLRRSGIIAGGVAVLILITALAILTALWIQRKEYWQNPIDGARFQTITDWDGVAQAATVSRDGHFVAFLSDRDGHMDAWLTQVGSGQFRNLTHGSVPELVNPEVRVLGFSPDGSLVTFWVRKPNASGGTDISIWAVPALGGQPRPYLEGVAEYDWSSDGRRLVYHTPGPGDPLFVSNGGIQSEGRHIFTAPAGVHSHFPLWSPDARFIYFVQGSLPDKFDIWRIAPAAGSPERITSTNSYVAYPVLLDSHMMMYLATDTDGWGPWLYSMDIERRVPHRVSFGLERYTSLAATADGHRLVASLATPKRTLWRLRFTDLTAEVSTATQIRLESTTAFSPRFGPNYLLYVSPAGRGETIWKLNNETATELWNTQDGRLLGAPAVSPDGKYIAFSVRQGPQTLLYVMLNDGTNVRVLTESLDLRGALAWAPDGQSLTSAADDHGTPHLLHIPIDGTPPTVLVREYSRDPAWAPDGSFLAYSGADIGTTFSVRAVSREGSPYPVPNLILARGSRHLVFSPRANALLFLRGEMQHKDIWMINLQTGAERQLTKVAADFDIRDFDISPDGRDLVVEREQERSNVVLLDLNR